MKRIDRWAFGEFEIDVAAGTLRKQGEPIKIGRQAFKALVLLVSRHGDLVSREDLQKEIWGDRVHVDFEHGLNVCIRQVRLALADDVDSNPIVVTCPREGYRLGVPARAITDSRWPRLQPWADAAAARWAMVGPWRLAATGAAVVVAGAATLTLTRPLQSASTTDATANVDRVVQAAGPTPTTGSPIIQPATFTRTWPTGNSEAHAWYWRGRAYYDRATGRKPAWALPYFETAAALDPDFALAYGSLAVSYLDRAAIGVSRQESLAKARKAADRAVALGPQLAETHVALAELAYRLDDDPSGAEREFQRAMQLDDRNAYARQRYAAFLHDQRRFEDALQHLQVAKALDPLSVMTNWQIANELYYTGRYDAAMAQATRTLELDSSHSWSFRTMGQSLQAVGRMDEAISAYLKAGQVALGHLGRAYALAGREADARELLDSLMRQPVDGTAHNGVAIAFILTGLGEHQKATEWLARTRRDGVRMPFSLRIEPQWDAVRASQSLEVAEKGEKGDDESER